MKKKSFAFGYSQVINWFICWVLSAFISGSGTNIYREAICNLHGFNMATILYMSTIIGLIGCILFVIAPVLIKKMGAKNLLVLSAIVASIVLIANPLVSNIYIAGILSGLNDALACIWCIVTTMTLVSNWFPRKKGAIMGIITAGGIVASVLVLPIFNAILNIKGINVAMGTLGGVLIVYGIISFFWLKEKPEEVGLLPDNLPMDETVHTLLNDNDKVWTISDLIKNKNFWSASIGWGFCMLGVIGFLSVAVTHLCSNGVDSNVAILCMALSGIATGIFSVISGAIDQKFGVLKSSAVCFIILAIGFFILGFIPQASPALLIVGFFFIMGAFGAPNNLYSSQTLSLMGVKNFSLGFSGLCLIASLLKVVGTAVCGFSLNATGNYMLSFKIFTVLMVLGLILVLLGGAKKIVPEEA